MKAQNMKVLVVGTTGGLFTVQFAKKGVTKNFVKVAKCYVWEDDLTYSGEIFGMQKATVLKKEYNAKDNMEKAVYGECEPVKNGEVVFICGTHNGENDGFYKFNLKGDFATVGKFEKVCDMEGN